MAVKYILFKFPTERPVYCAFQGRSGPGLSGNISFQVNDDPERVIAVREELLAALSPFGLRAWSECHQVHGTEILEDARPTPLGARPGSLPEADGMMTDKPGLGLMIKTADCQPIFITDMTGEHIMALHVGWRGNHANFPGSAMERYYFKYGVKYDSIFAVRGPSLGPTSAEFVNYEEEWGSSWNRWYNKKTQCMNLWSLTRTQIHDRVFAEGEQLFGQYSGAVHYDNIFEIDIDTALNEKDYFSYRRSRNTGRQANLIWIGK